MVVENGSKRSSSSQIDILRSMLPIEVTDDRQLIQNCRVDPPFLNAIAIAAMGEEAYKYEVHEKLNRDAYVIKKVSGLLTVLEGVPTSWPTFHEIDKISHMHPNDVKQMALYEDPQFEGCLNAVLPPVRHFRVKPEQGWLEYMLGPTWGAPFQNETDMTVYPKRNTHARLSKILEQARIENDKLVSQLAKKGDEFQQARGLLLSNIQSDDVTVRRKTRRTLLKVAKESDPISTDICLALALVIWMSQPQADNDDRGFQYWAEIQYWDGAPRSEEQGHIARRARSIIDHEFAGNDIDLLLDSILESTQKQTQLQGLKVLAELMCIESRNMSEELRSHLHRDICSMCTHILRCHAEEAPLPDVTITQILTPLAVRMLLYVIKRSLSLLESAKVTFLIPVAGAALARRESTLKISHLASKGVRPALSFIKEYVIKHEEWSVRELGIVVLADLLMEPFFLEMYKKDPINYLDVGMRPITRTFLDPQENGGVLRAAGKALDRLMRQVEYLLRHMVPWCTDEFALMCDTHRWKAFVALCTEIDPVYMERPVRSLNRVY